jgi:hypothetical protein
MAEPSMAVYAVHRSTDVSRRCSTSTDAVELMVPPPPAAHLTEGYTVVYVQDRSRAMHLVHGQFRSDQRGRFIDYQFQLARVRPKNHVSTCNTVVYGCNKNCLR